MYVIMVYDIAQERVNKVLKIGRKYLNWVQNSVLEGEITPANFERLKTELKQVIDTEYDAIKFYIFKHKNQFRSQILGREKRNPEEYII